MQSRDGSHYVGYMLAGAGGGGFLAIIAKKEGFGSKLQVIIAGSLVSRVRQH